MNGKVAIVTGASSGIGRATATLLAQNGASVIAVGRNEKDLVSLRDGFKSKKGSIKISLADVTEHSQLDRLVAETVQNFGQIDVLVNSAGIIKSGNIENTTIDDWDKMMNINPRSVFKVGEKCLTNLEARKGKI